MALVLVYTHVKTQVTTSLKDLLNKLFQFIDSLGAQHTEPLCGWCSGILENEDTLIVIGWICRGRQLLNVVLTCVIH